MPQMIVKDAADAAHGQPPILRAPCGPEAKNLLEEDVHDPLAPWMLGDHVGDRVAAHAVIHRLTPVVNVPRPTGRRRRWRTSAPAARRRPRVRQRRRWRHLPPAPQAPLHRQRACRSDDRSRGDRRRRGPLRDLQRRYRVHPRIPRGSRRMTATRFLPRAVPLIAPAPGTRITLTGLPSETLLTNTAKPLLPANSLMSMACRS